jgi:hypothetical protein
VQKIIAQGKYGKLHWDNHEKEIIMWDTLNLLLEKIKIIIGRILLVLHENDG